VTACDGTDAAVVTLAVTVVTVVTPPDAR